MAVPPPALPVTTDKPHLRAMLRAQRHAFVEALGEARHAQEQALADRVIARLDGCRAVSGYLAMGTEMTCMAVLDAAHARGIAIALPCIEVTPAHLVFRHWLPGDPLMEGPLRIRQPLPSAPPLDPDLILTPLIGFDRALGRIGQGKGYYDRAFVAHPHARRIGIAWSVQEVDAIPMDPWDVPLHGIATEREWIETA